MIVFLDDILIYSAFEEEHLQHLKLVFELLRKHALYAKESKCEFFQTKIHYLGHVIFADEGWTKIRLTLLYVGLIQRTSRSCRSSLGWRVFTASSLRITLR